MKTASRPTKQKPTQRGMTPAPASGQRRQVAANMNQNSRRSSPRLTAKGWATAVIPRISPRFAALLPITFPTARPGLSRSTATRLAPISGAEVP